ncbi:MAG TPA: arylamine N-acetyltransferase [Kofleriaceae bacterium]|nr:arylamine N-acetyltransferase [Kofleriaceae bacterium]
MNLDAYFARIGWEGARTATRPVLEGLLDRHMRHIPFENFDVLLGKPPSLDLAALEDKLVTRKRGGYCYEHTTLFVHVLAELGFTVKTHSARVVIMTPREQSPRTHMFATVLAGADTSFEPALLIDPGFGGLAPRKAVRVDGTPSGGHRLVAAEGAMRDRGALALEHGHQRLWISSMEHDNPIDFVMANHFTATWGQSPFVNRIMARAFTDDGEVRISNRDVTWTREGQSETWVLADRRALRQVVATHFGFDLPALESVRVPSIPEWT